MTRIYAPRFPVLVLPRLFDGPTDLELAQAAWREAKEEYKAARLSGDTRRQHIAYGRAKVATATVVRLEVRR